MEQQEIKRLCLVVENYASAVRDIDTIDSWRFDSIQTRYLKEVENIREMLVHLGVISNG